MSISTPVLPRPFSRGPDYSHPRNLYPHARNPYSHPSGILILIVPESLFTCPGIRRLMSVIEILRQRCLYPDTTLVYRCWKHMFSAYYGLSAGCRRPASSEFWTSHINAATRLGKPKQSKLRRATVTVEKGPYIPGDRPQILARSSQQERELRCKSGGSQT
jgi:hypothetical protein